MREPEGAPLLFFYSLGSRLHKTLAEVRALPLAELNGWRAFFAVERELNG